MTQHLIYLIGPPGAGKTTIMGALLPGDGWTANGKPFAHRTRGTVAVLGRERATFGGTDTLGMSVARTAEAWVQTCPAEFIIGEGDRLSYSRFFETAAGSGYRLSLFYIATPASEAASRRASRAAQAGTKLQNDAWVKGRASKAAKLAHEFGATRLDGTDRPEDAAARIRAAVDGLPGALR